MKMNRRKVMVFLALLLTIIVVIGTSYALWQFTFQQDDNNLVTSGCFKINYSDKNPIDLSGAFPIDDIVGQKLTPYEFTLTNICNNESSYNVNFEILNDTNIDYNNIIKIQFENETPKLLKDHLIVTPTLNNAVRSYTLNSGVLGVNQSVTLHLRLWIDEDVMIDSSDYGKFFNSKITVSASYIPVY